MSERINVKVGQVWMDNDHRGVNFIRFVKVLGTSDPAFSTVKIQSCLEDGSPLERRAPITFTNIFRFGKRGKIGFTLVRDVEGGA